MFDESFALLQRETLHQRRDGGGSSNFLCMNHAVPTAGIEMARYAIPSHHSPHQKNRTATMGNVTATKIDP